MELCRSIEVARTLDGLSLLHLHVAPHTAAAHLLLAHTVSIDQGVQSLLTGLASPRSRHVWLTFGIVTFESNHCWKVFVLVASSYVSIQRRSSNAEIITLTRFRWFWRGIDCQV